MLPLKKSIPLLLLCTFVIAAILYFGINKESADNNFSHPKIIQVETIDNTRIITFCSDGYIWKLVPGTGVSQVFRYNKFSKTSVPDQCGDN